MSSMSMEYSELANALAELRGVAAELDGGRKTLHDSFGGFLGNGWKGQAADSFRGGWEDWSTGVADVLGALRTMADLMEQQGRELKGLDAATHSSIAALHSRLGGDGS